MSSKSLPACLQEALRVHVAQSELKHDEELEGIFERLSRLNDRVEQVKEQIRQKRSGQLDRHR